MARQRKARLEGWALNRGEASKGWSKKRLAHTARDARGTIDHTRQCAAYSARRRVWRVKGAEGSGPREAEPTTTDHAKPQLPSRPQSRLFSWGKSRRQYLNTPLQAGQTKSMASAAAVSE